MSDETKACPNPECGGGGIKSARFKDTAVYTAWFFCGDCQTRGPQARAVDLDAVVAEARRLWNALPRATGPGEATRSLMEAMRDAIDGWEERDYLCFNHESGFGETVDRSTVAAALRENGMEAGS